MLKPRLLLFSGYLFIFASIGLMVAVLTQELTESDSHLTTQSENTSEISAELSRLSHLLNEKQALLAHQLTPDSLEDETLTLNELLKINSEISELKLSLKPRLTDTEAQLSWNQLQQLALHNPLSEENSHTESGPLAFVISFKEFLTTERLIHKEIALAREILARQTLDSMQENGEAHQQYHTIATVSWAITIILAGLITLWIVRNSQKNLRMLAVKKWRAEKVAERMSRQARSDALTNLPNRIEFNRHLQKCCYKAEKKGVFSALIFLDLDQFKVVNDTCGHHAGDYLLREVSTRLTSCIQQEKHIISRLGGDEFAILLKDTSLDEAKLVADQLMQCIREFRFLWEGRAFEIGASMGLVSITQPHCNPREILSAADAACYIAKDEGRNRIKAIDYGNKDLHNRLGEMNWAQELTHAIRENRLELFAQEIMPIQRTQTKTYHQFEFLVRLKTNQGKTVTPATFIPVAERYSIATQLDRWVVRNAFKWMEDLSNRGETCAQARNAQKARFSINLSGQSISDPDFLNYISRLLKSYNINPQQLCFEITETAVISNMRQASKFIDSLKQTGISFALDDFGSGMSSFAYLTDLKVNTLKIDGSLVRNAANNHVKYTILKSIVDIAKAMNVCTVAEFVENEKTLRTVEAAGIDFAQGYHLHRPQSIENILRDSGDGDEDCGTGINNPLQNTSRSLTA